MRQRPAQSWKCGQWRRHRRVRLADVGSEPEPHVRGAVRERDHEGVGRRSAPDVVLQHRRRGHRHPDHRRRHRVRGRLVGHLLRLDTATGEPRWTFQADDRPQGVRRQHRLDRGGRDRRRIDTVFFGSGRTLHALRADTGEPNGGRSMSGTADAGDFTEIESSPAVVDGKVLFGDRRAQPARITAAGLVALDVATGQPSSGTSTPSRAATTTAAATSGRPPASTANAGWSFIGTGELPGLTRGLGSVHRGDHRRRPGRPESPAGRTNRTSPTTTTSTSPEHRTCSRSTVVTSSASGTRTAPTTPSTATPASSSGRPRPPDPGLDESPARTSRPAGSSPRPPTPTASSPAAPPSAPHPTSTPSTRPTATSCGSPPRCRPPTAPSAIVDGVLFSGGNDFTLRAFDARHRRGALVRTR